jgi:ribosomal protein S18 acetylase RimI-like enzyme
MRLAVWHRMGAAEREAITRLFAGLSVERETFRLPLDEALLSSPIIVVEAEDGLAGACGWQVGEQVARWWGVVRQEYQGLGWGRRMMLASLDVAPAGRLELSVMPRNRRAIHLYEQTGWQELWRDEEQVDMWWPR